MVKPKLKVSIITQEGLLLETDGIVQITVMTETGEITILPNHSPLLTRLKPGILTFVDDKQAEHFVAIFGGFLEITQYPQSAVSILADSAVRAEDVDLARVERAKAEAEAIIKGKVSTQAMVEAETSLQRAYLELQVASRLSRRTRHSPSPNLP